MLSVFDKSSLTNTLHYIVIVCCLSSRMFAVVVVAIIVFSFYIILYTKYETKQFYKGSFFLYLLFLPKDFISSHYDINLELFK